jgi:ComF family protein
MARAPFLYEGPAREALHRLKFSGWRAVARALAGPMAAVNEFDADAVTWVPLSGRRRARRGYDQARALAARVGEVLGLPVSPLLVRVRDTAPQARRTGAERRRSMQGAFRSSGRASPARVLLVDDVLTTGATAAECARVLRAAGAREVALLTAARAVSGSVPARCYTRDGSRLGL